MCFPKLPVSLTYIQAQRLFSIHTCCCGCRRPAVPGWRCMSCNSCQAPPQQGPGSAAGSSSSSTCSGSTSSGTSDPSGTSSNSSATITTQQGSSLWAGHVTTRSSRSRQQQLRHMPALQGQPDACSSCSSSGGPVCCSAAGSSCCCQGDATGWPDSSHKLHTSLCCVCGAYDGCTTGYMA